MEVMDENGNGSALDEDDHGEIGGTPPSLKETADAAVADLVPQRSKRQYEKAFNDFQAWCSARGVRNGYLSENIVIAYLGELSSRYAPSTLWSIFSMLKSTLLVHSGKDIKGFEKVHAFLKRKSGNFTAKKSEVFSRENIMEFLSRAPDDQYLAVKLAMLFGIFGACRKGELAKMKVNDITDHDDHLFIRVPETKTGVPRTFVVVGHTDPVYNALLCYRKYVALRPSFSVDNPIQYRFFLKYGSGKCSRQPIGAHTFGKMPSEVATFLKLNNPLRFTGHALRRSAATLLADKGIDIVNLKRFGGWKSDSVAEGYIGDSKQNKRKLAETMLADHDKESNSNNKENLEGKINFSNCINCTFNIAINNDKQ